MTEFVIDTNQLRTCASQISALRHELDTVAVKLGAMQLGSVLQIRASTALIGKVADCKWAAANQSGDLRNLVNGLNDIAELYDSCEKNLMDPKTQLQAEAQEQVETNPWDRYLPEWLRDLIGRWGDLVDIELGDNVVCTFLSFVLNWYGNLGEFDGDMQSIDFWLETFGETAAGVLITGLATLAAGPAGVGVVWALDIIAQHVHQKSLAEILSDGVIGVGNEMGQNISDLIFYGQINEEMRDQIISSMILYILAGPTIAITDDFADFASWIVEEGTQT